MNHNKEMRHASQDALLATQSNLSDLTKRVRLLEASVARLRAFFSAVFINACVFLVTLFFSKPPLKSVVLTVRCGVLIWTFVNLVMQLGPSALR